MSAKTIAKRLLPARVSQLMRRSGRPREQWAREVMNQDVQREIRALQPERLSVAEVSGDLWGDWEWGSRTVFHFKGLDLCNPPAELPQFDLVPCEQVLEHVIDPITGSRSEIVFEALPIDGLDQPIFGPR